MTTKAIAYSAYGTAADLELVDTPEPEVGPGEVLVRVKAAGVNPVGWSIAAGYLDPILEVRYPVIPGWDVAGIVEAVGADTFDYAVGDEVYGYVRKVGRTPTPNWSAPPSAPSPASPAAGGTGSFGVQIAVALGLRVIGTAGAHNHDYLRSLGAEPVLYGDGMADRIRELAPEGVDAALDFYGDDVIDILQSLVKQHDRVVSIADYEAAAKGAHQLWVRPDTADLTFLAEPADSGCLTVNVEHALPLAEAARAWEPSAAGRTRGKIVLTV